MSALSETAKSPNNFVFPPKNPESSPTVRYNVYRRPSRTSATLTNPAGFEARIIIWVFGTNGDIISIERRTGRVAGPNKDTRLCDNSSVMKEYGGMVRSYLICPVSSSRGLISILPDSVCGLLVIVDDGAIDGW